MMQLNRHRAGLAVGGLFGVLHLLWSQMVAFGWAQSFVDFVYRIHRIAPTPVVEPFRVDLAVALIVTTAVIGYVIGAGFAAMWNAMDRGSTK